MRLRNILFVSALLAIGCNSSDVEQTKPIPTAKAAPVDAPAGDSANQTIREATTKKYGGVKFTVPAGWEEKALSSTMVVGEFALPGDAGPGRLTLSTAGGGTAANIDRWKGQLKRGPDDPEPKESEIRASGKQVTVIEVHGTFTDMFGGGGPKSHWQLLGAAIPIDAEHNYFVKLTGPRETVSARRDEFMKFVESAEFE